MRYLEYSAQDPALDLAIDEALLLSAESQLVALEEGTTSQAASVVDQNGVLRIWEPAETMVVIGRGSKVRDEVDCARCESLGIPVLRRCSGGASVVGAPGCLMYSVVLSYEALPQLRRLDQAHQYVMSRIEAAVRAAGVPVTLQGTCDLTWNNQKVSGNALRCRRHHLLYHGTLLYDMDLSLVESLLKMPPRQPDYRAGRSHDGFVACLPVSRRTLIEALQAAWQVDPAAPPRASLEAMLHDARRLADERYRLRDWTYRL